MAIDRGGLQYQIQIDGNFAAQLQLFRTELASARASWASFRKDLSSLSSESARAKGAVEGLGTAAQEQAAGTKAAKVAITGLLTAEEALTKANQKLLIEARALQVAREAEMMAAQGTEEATVRSVIQRRAEAAAARDIAKILENQIRVRERARLAQELGVVTSQQAAVAFNAEAEAVKKITAAEQAMAIERALTAKGKQANGRPATDLQGPPVSPEMKAQMDAQVQFEKDLQNLRKKSSVQDLRKNSEEYQRLTGQLQTVSTATRGVSKEMEDADTRINRISFTFRRLFGIMAAFTIVRQVVQQFNNLVVAAVKSAAAVEQLETGIAGLLVSTGTVRDSFGNVVSQQNAFNVAQDVSRKQLAKLRVDAQKTAGSFEELAFAFQTAIGPGLREGLQLDAIREFTVLISQAAQKAGVAQNQLAEEIRSLLEGTITPRNTRIATILSITNDDIKRAKEMGNLMGFIMSRFKGIEQAGTASLSQMTTQATNAADALKLLLITAGGTFFNDLKNLLKSFQEALQKEVDGVLKDNPAAVQAFAALFDGLAIGVKTAADAIKAINFGNLEQVFGLLGETLGTLVSFATKLVTVLIAGFTPVAQVLRIALVAVRGFINSLAGLDSATGGVGSQLLKWVIALEATRFAALALFGIVKSLTGASAVLKASWYLLRGAAVAFEAVLGIATARMKVFELLTKASMKWLLIGLAALLFVAKGLEKLGLLKDVLQKVEDFVSPLVQSVDEVLARILGLNKATSTAVESTTATVTASLTQIKSETDQIIGDIEKTAREAQRKLMLGIATIGVGSEVEKQIRSTYEAIGQQEEKTREITLQINSLQEKRVALANEFVGLQKKQNTLAEDEKNTLRVAMSVREDIIALEKQQNLLAQARNDEADRLAIKIDAAKKRGASDADLLADRQRLAVLKDMNSMETDTKTALDAKKKIYAQILDSSQAVKAVSEAINANGAAEKAVLDEIAALERGRLDVKRSALDMAAKEVVLTAKQADFAMQREKIDAQLSANQLQRQAAAITANDTNTLARLQLQDQLETKSLERKRAELDLEANLHGLEETKSKFSKDSVDQQQAILALDEQISMQRQLGAAQLAKINGELAVTNAQLAELKLQQEGTFLQGLGRGGQTFAQDNSSFFKIGTDFAQNALSSITNFAGDSIGQSIAAAFDPNRNFDLKKAAGDLALSLATDLTKQLIASLLSSVISSLLTKTPEAASGVTPAVAMASAAAALDLAGSTLAGAGLGLEGAASALSITSGFWDTVVTGLTTSAGLLTDAALAMAASKSAFATGGPVFGFAKGGPTPQGFAVGGRPRHSFPRPRGLDNRDRIPIWARAGEWVIRPEAVKLYGHAFMAAVNNRRINPDIASSLGGVTRRTAARRLSGPGFASGGSVAGRTQQEAAVGSQPMQQAVQLVQPIQLHDEQTLDQALAAGPKAMNRFARLNRTSMRAALGI